jgi:hypothetical protein
VGPGSIGSRTHFNNIWAVCHCRKCKLHEIQQENDSDEDWEARRDREWERARWLDREMGSREREMTRSQDWVVGTNMEWEVVRERYVGT